VNYLLLKVYGTRGVEMTGFFAGLVNSTVAVTELSARVREEGRALLNAAYRGVILAVMAMLLRNYVLLGLLAPEALLRAGISTALMLLGSLALAFLPRASRVAAGSRADGLPRGLRSPFSLKAALQFGFVFLVLDAAGTLAQRFLGQLGFYAVSILGGLVSSASAVAAAGTLAAHGKLSWAVAANGAVLASLTRALVKLPVVTRVAADRDLTRRLAIALGAITVLGIVGLFLSHWVLPP
jgi:uncharacterized membrane protein (DUF4010 family)